MPKLSCKEAQALLDAFHDNELDNVSSLSVQQHLENCPDCRRHWRWLCEVEASLQRLNDTVPLPSPDLRSRLTRRPVKQSSPLVAFFRARRRLAGVASFALLLALGIFIMLSEKTGADVMLFVRDSAEVTQNGAPLELRSSNTEAAEQWIRQQIGFAPAIRTPSGFRLVGARSCHINGEPVGYLLFERNGQRIACYVSRSSMTALHGYDGTTSEGIKLGACEGRQVAAWDAGYTSYLLVSDLTKDVFIAAASEVAAGTIRSLKE
jgi:anti-sigma factor RsiW